MTEAEYRALDPSADSLNEACDRWFATPEMAALAQALRRAAASLPPSFTVSMDVELRVFDSERERSLTLLTTGIVVQADGEPYRASGDSTVHRYIADGTLCELPHDRCPRCWAVWDWKMQQPTCRTCHAEMGKDVRLLLDSDVCPNCERGHINSSNTLCKDCGFTTDPRFVTWG